MKSINWLKEIVKSGEYQKELINYQAEFFSMMNFDKQVILLKKLREIPRYYETKATKTITLFNL